jgi:hypothetical protein
LVVITTRAADAGFEDFVDSIASVTQSALFELEASR